MIKTFEEGDSKVKGKPAKVDIDLIVENPANEMSYIPELETLGYELIIREPSWYQHRMLKLYYPQVNLHIFAPNCLEYWRHLLFKRWLQTDPEDLAKYAALKEIAKIRVETEDAYKQKKVSVVREVYGRIFAGL